MYRLIILIVVSFSSLFVKAQIDYTKSWEDLYSYNHIVDFVLTDSNIIALSDNAIFLHDLSSKEFEKISSVNGLSGMTTSAFYYDENLNKIVIGYENGLVEIIDENRSVTIKPDILNFSITGSKRINDIAVDGTTLFLSVPFGIVTFDLETNDFADTYFIGASSSEVSVNEIEIFDNKIYAATENGVFIADLNEPFLVDSQNWTQHHSLKNFSNIESFNNSIFVSENQSLFRIGNDNTLTLINTQYQAIRDITATQEYMCITTKLYIRIYGTNLLLAHEVVSEVGDIFPYTANTAQVYDNNLYIGTEDFGILESNFSAIESFEELHPEGPISNKVYSISQRNNHIWVVYGGTGASFAPLNVKKGASHYNGEEWVTIPFAEDAITERNLVYVSIDPFHDNKVYVSSFADGMVVIENDEVVAHWNQTNSPLESVVDPGNPNYISVRIGDSVFDAEGSLWITNIGVVDRLKKYSTSGVWSSYNLSSLQSGGWGMKSMIIDKTSNIWMGTRQSGAWAVTKHVDKMKALTKNPIAGNIPHVNVRAVAVDDNNTIWIGTREGLVTFNSSTSFFDQATYAAQPVVIASGEDDGFGVALLGSQRINAICVDGANNKWFGTDTGGVLYTNSSGKETFLHFDTSNSPLPSNKILHIVFDENTGKVYFATDMGIVSYDSNIAPYGAHLEEVYAYPNPVTKNHEFVTIDGRNGTHIPNGSNVKILDAAGRLVYETNVVAGQEQFGGKVVWNKTNLAGRKVASGIYIVLLTTDDSSETAMTKIAIIN